MRLAAMATFLFGLLVSPSQVVAQTPLYYYCYAPDPATGTVYMSQPQAAGPVAERSSYSRAYVDYLRKTGKLKNDIQAYCTMRSSIAELEQSRSKLPYEPCPECVGVRRFESAPWPRNGSLAKNEIEATRVDRKEVLPAPKISKAAQLPLEKKVADELIIVVMGNAETGKLVKLSNQANLRARTEAQAFSIRPTGWKTLLASATAGFGVAVCVEKEGVTHFFVVHGVETQKAAVDQARQKARAFVAENGGAEKACSAPWQIGNGLDTFPEASAIDVIQDLIKEQVTCDPTLPKVTARKLSLLRKQVRAPQKTERDDKASEKVGRGPCVKESVPSAGARG